jgi:filamentous hemagglutinin
MPGIVIAEERVDHIFREADGHFPEDTAVNREALIGTANRSGNYLGTDRFGNGWFAEVRADGTQIWVQVREGRIMNGGVNATPRDFDFAASSAFPGSGAMS